ncbi:MAG: hypothetical protein GY737_20845 [Desulfobacteraceae bacterium]|nr:hypothetical protein [Desulfobacteraceae bacterium]
MNKILILVVTFYILLSGYASASYHVTVDPADPYGYAWFQFDSNGDTKFDLDDINTVEEPSWPTDYITYDSISKANLKIKDSLDGAIRFRTTGYCIDYYTPADNGFADLEELSGNQKKAAWLLEYSIDSDKHEDTPYDNIALQLAIWKVLYGDQLNMLDGLNRRANMNYDEIYASYIDYTTAVKGQEYNGTDYQILNFGDAQDMIIRTVPIPPAIVLMGLGLVGITSVRRNKMLNS